MREQGRTGVVGCNKVEGSGLEGDRPVFCLEGHMPLLCNQLINKSVNYFVISVRVLPEVVTLRSALVS